MAVSAAKVLLFGLVGLIVGELVTLWQDGVSPLLSAALSVLAGSIPLIGEYLKNDGGDRSERTPAGNARGAGRMPPQPPVRHHLDHRRRNDPDGDGAGGPARTGDRAVG